MPTPDDGKLNPVVIWDLPVRITHWGFVLMLPALWWTAEEGDLALHRQLGLVMLGLIVFRLLWGIFGSSTARFSQFVAGPSRVWAYLQSALANREEKVLGHNPLGSWSVIALLLALSIQVVLGLFAQDVDGLESGPLSYLIDYDTSDSAREWHELLFNGILGLIVLHLIAIAIYVFAKRDNLITPMLTGRKDVCVDIEAPIMAPPLRAVICAIVAASTSWWVSIGAPLSANGV
jgi:cytochrome b